MKIDIIIRPHTSTDASVELYQKYRDQVPDTYSEVSYTTIKRIQAEALYGNYLDKAETAEFFDKIILVHTEPVSTYPKYLYLPDWSADEDTKFTELFSYQNCTSAIKAITEDAGAKLLYHDISNGNCNPELVFEIPNSVSAEILFFLLTGQKLKKDIPTDQVIAFMLRDGECSFEKDQDDFQVNDILDMIKKNDHANLINK